MNFIIYGALGLAIAFAVLYTLATWMRLIDAMESYNKYPRIYQRPRLNFGLFVFELIVRGIIGIIFGGALGTAAYAIKLVAL